jgi:hypothetical protein
LQLAGVQFQLDDLTMDEWLLLAEMKIAMEEYKYGTGQQG